MNADKNAIDAVKKGDRDRFEELVQRHKRMVYAIAWSHLGDPDTCEDAAQETFIKAFRYLGALRDAEKFPGWLSRIARNVSVSLLRKRQTELERRKRWQAEQDPPATMPTANEDQESLKEMLGKALGDLPAQQRECLVLFYIEGKSIREVASILGLNEGAVKTRLHRARQALRGMLEEQIERELHGLSPRKGFVASVMLLLPEKPLGTIGIGGGASLAGKAVSGIGKLGSTLMLGFWMVFAQTAFFYLMMRWFARMEMANLIDKPENEFRKAQLRRNLLVVTVGVLCVLALSHFGIRILGYSGFYMLLAVYCAWGVYRAILLLRVNRSSYTWGQLVSILTFLLVSVLMGFFGAPPALFFLALVILNLILFFTNRQLPRRQDYNLFLRQSQVLLHEPESDLTPSRPVSVPELKAFARFLGEQWLVWDYSIRLSSIILRLPPVRTSLTKTFFMTGTGDSFIQIKNDGNCLLRLSPIDRKAIEKLTDRPIDEDELIDKVRRTIKAALTHFLNGQKQAARHLLSPVKDDAIFKTEYSKTRGYRIQIGIALVASITLLIGSSYMGAWRWGVPYWFNAWNGIPVSEKMAREAIGEWISEYAPSSRADLLYLWGGSAHPSMNLVPEKEIDDYKEIVASQLKYEFESETKDAIECRIINAMLQPSLLYQTVETPILTGEELSALGFTPKTIQETLSNLNDDWRQKIFYPQKTTYSRSVNHTVDRYRLIDMETFAKRLFLLKHFGCLDLVDIDARAKEIARWQIKQGYNLPEGFVPIDQDLARGLFHPGWCGLSKTWASLYALKTMDRLDLIDREACIEGILRLYRGKGVFKVKQPLKSNVMVLGRDGDAFYAMECLVLLDALDRIQDFNKWEFHPVTQSVTKDHKTSPGHVTGTSLQTWAYQERLVLRQAEWEEARRQKISSN